MGLQNFHQAHVIKLVEGFVYSKVKAGTTGLRLFMLYMMFSSAAIVSIVPLLGISSY